MHCSLRRGHCVVDKELVSRREVLWVSKGISVCTIGS